MDGFVDTRSGAPDDFISSASSLTSHATSIPAQEPDEWRTLSPKYDALLRQFPQLVGNYLTYSVPDHIGPEGAIRSTLRIHSFQTNNPACPDGLLVVEQCDGRVYVNQDDTKHILFAQPQRPATASKTAELHGEWNLL